MKRKGIILFGLMAVVIYFIGLYTDNYILRMSSKAFPVLALLALIKPNTRFKKFIFIGLVFSVCGDMLLESSSDMFVFGLVAFLTGHVSYIVAFTGRNRKLTLVPLVFIFAYGVGIYWVLLPGLNEMAIPVLLYGMVILTMVWRAIAQGKVDKYAMFAVVGSIFFVFSDSIIAIDKFHTAVPFARWIIMCSYWTAQTLIFYSAYKSTK